jgi:medium-chain acyl-[acyl-carrier-protein] hydrolase
MSADHLAWFGGRPPRAYSRIRLFCLPYAGGSAYIYRGWEKWLPAEIELCAIDLPGRGTRTREPLATRIRSLVEPLGRALEPYLDRPFAFFGHSMGALICFETARHLRAAYAVEPLALFPSGWRAPHLSCGRRDFALPDEEFVSVLRRLDGTPDEILDDPEALAFLLPILKADFELTQTFEYTDGRPLGCSIIAFGGSEDPGTPPDVIRPWMIHATGTFALNIFPGHHFFLHNFGQQLCRTMSDELAREYRLLAPTASPSLSQYRC